MNYRRFTPTDRQPVFRLFRDSIQDYMLGLGMVEANQVVDYEGLYRKQEGLFLHLEETAAEDWLAEDDHGKIVGWARSIERDNHLQLTHFFVDPATQSTGVGRQLLQRAFPPGRGEQRSIIATTNPGALSLYLRHGVDFRSMAFCFVGAPQRRDIEHELQIERASAGEETLQQLLDIDARVLGFRRAVDLQHFMEQQPVYLARRDGQLAGYALGSNGGQSGPAAALDAADLPSLLQQVENSACDAGQEELALMIPAVASAAVDWALASGYRIDPFYEVLLSSSPMQLDRYLLSEFTFNW